MLPILDVAMDGPNIMIRSIGEATVKGVPVLLDAWRLPATAFLSSLSPEQRTYLRKALDDADRQVHQSQLQTDQ